MNHKDSMGYSDVVEKDWVQIMSAGTGLRHEEYNIGDEEVNFLQIWIEPKLQNIAPRYQRRYFDKSKRKNKLQPIIGNQEGVKHCWINQNAKLSLGSLDKGVSLPYGLDKQNKGVYVFVIEGALKINEQVLNKRDAMGIWDTDIFYLTAEQEAEFIVIEVPINH